ncbi:MAG: RDD family protein [Acidimicrobiales bacterium]
MTSEKEDQVTQPPESNSGESAQAVAGGFPSSAAAAGYPYGQQAGVVPEGMYFDAASGLTLPQGVQLAPVGRRIGAFFLSIPLVIVTLVIGYVVWGAVIWARGQTPALQVLGMRCWRPESGRVAGWWWMALREIVGRMVEDIVGLITLIVSFVLMVAGKEHKSLHDIIAGTVVLHDPNKILAT